MCKAKALWNHKHCLWFSLSNKIDNVILSIFLYSFYFQITRLFQSFIKSKIARFSFLAKRFFKLQWHFLFAE